MNDRQLALIEYKAILGVRLCDIAAEMYQQAALWEMMDSPEVSACLSTIVDACECARSAIHFEGTI